MPRSMLGFTYTTSHDHHNHPETYQYDNRKRVSHLPEVTAKWLHCVDGLHVNPGLFFCKEMLFPA